MGRHGSATLGKELPSVTYRITEYFGRLEREGRSIVPTDSLSHVLHEMERCNVCKASRSNCSTSCNMTHWNDSLVRMHTEVAAMLSPQAQAHCWLWSPNEYSTCSRLITPPRVSQLMYYHDLVRAAIDEPLLSLTLQKPLVFLGDSLAEHMFVAAQCQAARTGRIPGRVRFIPLQNFNDRRFHHSRQGRAFERMRVVTMRGVLDKLSQLGGGTIAACVGMHYNNVAINLMAQAAGVKEGVNQLSRTDFQDDIDVLFRLLGGFAASCAGCHAIIVTAPSQHFPTIDGSFSPRVVQDGNSSWESVGAGCARISTHGPINGSVANSWRGADVLERHSQTSNITIVPWHLLTRNWWDTHGGLSETNWRNNPVKASDHKLMLDCTHYCYTPFLYEPLWWSFDRVIKGQVLTEAAV